MRRWSIRRGEGVSDLLYRAVDGGKEPNPVRLTNRIDPFVESRGSEDSALKQQPCRTIRKCRTPEL